MEFTAVRRDVRPNQILDLDGLFATNGRDNAETQMPQPWRK